MNNYIEGYLPILQKQYPDKEFIYQTDKTGRFERIIYKDEPIIETEWFYIPNSKIIDIDSGRIAVHLHCGKELHCVNYNYHGIEVHDPNKENKSQQMSWHFTLKGSSKFIKQVIPFVFEPDEDGLEKLSKSLEKQNNILRDFL